MDNQDLGKPLWHDLTVPDAAGLVPFYQAVCNWQASEHSMGDYVDYNMSNAAGERVAGLCHARRGNAKLPPVWMMYVAVPSLSDALVAVRAHGGLVLHETPDTYAVITDPAGASLALWQPGADA